MAARKKSTSRKKAASKPAARRQAARNPVARKPAVRRAAARTARKPVPRATKKKAPKTGVRRKPEALRIGSVSPTLTVADLVKSIHFYSHVLGFPVGGRWEDDGKLQGVEVKSGRTAILLNQDDWQKGRDRVKGLGFRMYWSTTQDVDDIAAGIRARGGILDHEPHDTEWGTRSFGLTDPDGFKITVSRRI
jgi:catechol 2,3-dioxygenase-like lactoylglutathione lyase family enzyme